MLFCATYDLLNLYTPLRGKYLRVTLRGVGVLTPGQRIFFFFHVVLHRASRLPEQVRLIIFLVVF